MAQPISDALTINPKLLEDKGIFNAILGVDTHLFIDPQLLKQASIPEFKDSYVKIEKYFSDIITLLSVSSKKGDRAWVEVYKRLIFKELQGVSIGYGAHSSDGSAIGPELAAKLINSATEILTLGIKDPEVFLLLGLFEEDFGADRLSDMVISIIKQDLYAFAQRMVKELGIKNTIKLTTSHGTYLLPKNPNKKGALILLPKELLRDLPVALDRDGIDHVVAVNQQLRNRLNQLIGAAWKRKITKKEIKDLIFSKKENLEILLEAYKNNKSGQYDFKSDPAGQILWYGLGQMFAANNPISLDLKKDATIDDLENVVRKMISQFQRNIEVNGLNEHLYIKENGVLKPRHERFSQLLFYSTADTYCEANNIDLNREPNAGNGPVDFKISKGYVSRILVELKLSSNPKLIGGYEKQLEAYEESERTKRSIYIVLRITRSDAQVKRLLQLKDRLTQEGKQVPSIIVVDARLKPSASRL